MLRNFSVQLSSVNLFRRIEADQVIETTINKDGKCPGGWKGFSAKADPVTRWVKNATHRASLKHELHEFVNLGSGENLHKDLSKTRIKKDLKGVQEINHLLKEVFIHPFEEQGLVSLSNGIVATRDIKDDLMNTYWLGNKAMNNFINERLSENGSVDFLEPVKKLNLKTFEHIMEVIKVSVKDRIIPLKVHRDLLGQIVPIMQRQSINLQNVFYYPLGPLSWALSGSVGELCMTNKLALLHGLKKDATPLTPPPRNHSVIIDGMAVEQKCKPTGKTIEQMASDMLELILSTTKQAERIKIVFDIYRESSITNAERMRRLSVKLNFSRIVSSQVIRQ